ncbi:unnamed protein product [Heterosigma akashiwo]
MKLNFNLPHQTLYAEKNVKMVLIPGVEGEYGVTAGHSPLVSELKPGVVQIIHEEGSEPEKYFVSGGFALTHPNSATDIWRSRQCWWRTCSGAAVAQHHAEFKKALRGRPGSSARAEAQISMGVTAAMASAVGVSL